MVQTRPGEAGGDHAQAPGVFAAMAGSSPEHVRTQWGDLARVDRLERIAKTIAHLTKASDRLAVANISDNVALAAMDRINFEIEVLTYERNQLQVEEDLALADALDMARRRSSLLESVLMLPDEAIPEALWSLYDEVDGNEVAFAEALGLEPSNQDTQFVFSLIHNSIGDRE